MAAASMTAATSSRNSSGNDVKRVSPTEVATTTKKIRRRRERARVTRVAVLMTSSATAMATFPVTRASRKAAHAALHAEQRGYGDQHGVGVEAKNADAHGKQATGRAAIATQTTGTSRSKALLGNTRTRALSKGAETGAGTATGMAYCAATGTMSTTTAAGKGRARGHIIGAGHGHCCGDCAAGSHGLIFARCWTCSRSQARTCSRAWRLGD